MESYSYKFYQVLPEIAKSIRSKVFIEEQKFSEEFDAIDAKAIHLIIWVNQIAVGTARIFLTEDRQGYHLGRLAVLKEYRKQGIGARMIGILETKCKTLGADYIVLSAQLQARGFYEGLGYVSQGEVYLDEHCPHIKMQKSL